MSYSTISAKCTFRPTYIGHIETKLDACLLLEACLSGKLYHTPRFPWKNERQYIVCSGNAFVYADVATGTGHWDDGKNWIFLSHEDGFLVEREGSGSHKLCRKSVSIIVQGVTHQIVSYYKAEDTVQSYSGGSNSLLEILTRPSQDYNFKGITLRPDLAVLVPAQNTAGFVRRQG